MDGSGVSMHDRVRVYDVIRSAHLERAHTFGPATILFRRHRYDFDPSLLDGLALQQVTTYRLFRTLITAEVQVLEINEPLQRTGLWRSAVAVLAVRLGGRLRGIPSRVVSYAIENRDPFGRREERIRTALRHRAEALVSGWLVRHLDRLAFGTSGAAAVYRRRFGQSLPADRAVVPALPAACRCGADLDASESVIFVGALQPRKGIDRLIAAWPLVLAHRPSARLMIIGTGPLEPQVRAFADARDEVQLLIDPPRSTIHAQLRRHRVLVLFSQPGPHWREQVGLPIVEGLAHGCRIVTSTETGLADWLADHDHRVLDPAAPSTELAAAVSSTLARGDDHRSVLATLPDQDGREAADQWLMSPT